MYHYVYKFTDLTNMKAYVGKRSCLCPIEEDNYKTSSKIVRPMLQERPWDFKKEILWVYQGQNDEEGEIEAYKAESKFCTETHIKTGMFYNIVPGGGNFKAMCGKYNPFYGKKHTAETKQLMSKNHADFTKEKHPGWGSKRSEESKKKMSLAKKGKPSPHKGRVHTEQAKNNMSLGVKNKIRVCVDNIWF